MEATTEPEYDESEDVFTPAVLDYMDDHGVSVDQVVDFTVENWGEDAREWVTAQMTAEQPISMFVFLTVAELAKVTQDELLQDILRRVGITEPLTIEDVFDFSAAEGLDEGDAPSQA